MPIHDLEHQTFLVTGANSGIGRATVDALLARGGRIVFAARSEAKSAPVIAALRQAYPSASIQFLALDLADLTSVRQAAESYIASGAPLDVLINNAGIAGGSGTTRDGFELITGTNHLGPFLLTQLLLPLLQAAPQGRIVNVSSKAQNMAKGIDWTVLEQPTAPRRSIAMYGVSKLMNTLHANELARRLLGTRVTTYSLHPGVVASDIWRSVPQPFQALIKLLMITNEKGALTSLYCATVPELATTSGRFYDKSREAKPNPLAHDESLARRLFDWSTAAVNRPSTS